MRAPWLQLERVDFFCPLKRHYPTGLIERPFECHGFSEDKGQRGVVRAYEWVLASAVDRAPPHAVFRGEGFRIFDRGNAFSCASDSKVFEVRSLKNRARWLRR